MNATALRNAAARFNRLNLRERALVSAGIIALLILAWDSLLMKPLGAHRTELTQELENLKQGFTTLEQMDKQSDNPLVHALEQEKQLQQTLAGIDAELQA